MIKLTRIDTIMVSIAMIFILSQLQIEPESIPTIYNGVYEFTDSVLKGLVGLITIKLLSRK